jgi:hypothetical protein
MGGIALRVTESHKPHHHKMETPLESVTTSNTALSLIYTFYSSPLHTLRFSVFTNCILATDLQQSHCQYSLYNLITFLPSSQLLCQLPLPESRLDFVSLLRSSYPGRQASRNSTNSNDHLRPFYIPSACITQETQPLHC